MTMPLHASYLHSVLHGHSAVAIASTHGVKVRCVQAGALKYGRRLLAAQFWKSRPASIGELFARRIFLLQLLAEATNSNI